MTNREYIQSLPDEEFAKYLDIYDICDYKHEFQKRCDAMNGDCRACMLDFLRAEHIEEEK